MRYVGGFERDGLPSLSLDPKRWSLMLLRCGPETERATLFGPV